MTADLAAVHRWFAVGDLHFGTSPLYAALSATVAEDEELLTLAAQSRAGQMPSNLLFAAVHFLLLGNAGDYSDATGAELAAYYPSIVGDRARPPEGAGPAFGRFCAAYRDDLVALLRVRLVQTNVVKRSVALRLGLAAVGALVDEPVTLVEIGCSAGVHLCLDRWGYRLSGDFGQLSYGDPDSRVQIETRWLGPSVPPDLDRLPTIIDRLGIDLNPIDVTDPVERRWLRSLIWPENQHEAQILDEALAVVAADPPRMVRADISEGVPAGLVGGTGPLVVVHSVTRAHVSKEKRAAFDAAIAGLGADRPLYWLSNEGSTRFDELSRARGFAELAGLPGHVLELRYDGEVRQLAAVEGHADWIAPLD